MTEPIADRLSSAPWLDDDALAEEVLRLELRLDVLLSIQALREERATDEAGKRLVKEHESKAIAAPLLADRMAALIERGGPQSVASLINGLDESEGAITAVLDRDNTFLRVAEGGGPYRVYLRAKFPLSPALAQDGHAEKANAMTEALIVDCIRRGGPRSVECLAVELGESLKTVRAALNASALVRQEATGVWRCAPAPKDGAP